ncbi:cell cycle control protein cwf14 [Blastomyces dermatitidis ER-3]|uniref:Cell cycle control protein cwf14 n=1 Tax=Ajellomyces dermatitidis (strain ER-3 / ATCC MYA-2586) TaxID=559297 RepID=A0ABP2F4R0_AJEDR|nr:cell cycle control protein cwf14 [Blastomyces dermatitidis ER-3]EEQ90209.1 cell cycle control protein cwf14 [Blastomyces dermatitidis ER-3]
MPPIRSSRTRKPPPDGFDDIEDTLLEFSNKMKDAENASHEGKKRHEVLWPIFQISHARSRYIYDLYYEKEAISKQLYDWLLKITTRTPCLLQNGRSRVMKSSAASAASRPKKQISTPRASAACRKPSSKKTRASSASAVVVAVAAVAIRVAGNGVGIMCNAEFWALWVFFFL